MPTDETLRGIRLAWEREECSYVALDAEESPEKSYTIETSVSELADLQHRTWDAGYAAGIEAAKQDAFSSVWDALKAVDRG